VKKLHILMPLLAALFCVSVQAAGEGTDIVERAAEALNLERVEQALPDDARSLLDGLDVMDASDLGAQLHTLAANVLYRSTGALRAGLTCALQLLGIAALCGLAQGMLKAADADIPVVSAAGALAAGAAMLSQTGGMLTLAQDAIEEMNIFSKALLPVMTAACTASGAAVSAASRHAVVVFLTDVVITAIHAAVVPMAYSNIALQIACCISGADSLAKLATQLRNFMNSFLRTLLTLFMTYFALSGVITGSADAMTLRTLKLTLSSTLPVVGGIMSDAANAVLTGAQIVRSSIGVFGMLGLLAIGVVPFVQIGIRYLCVRMAAVFASMSNDTGVARLIEGMADSFGLLLGLCGSCILLLMMSVFVGMTAWGL